MRQLFLQRRRDFHAQQLKYLRYVLNDHFVLFLMVAVGYVSLQYAQLLRHFPRQTLLIWLGLSLVSVILLLVGRPATYLEKSDQLFLLPQERELLREVKLAKWRACLTWGSVQTVVLCLLLPIYLKLGWSIYVFVVYVLTMLVIRYMVLTYQQKAYIKGDRLDFQSAIQKELTRKQSILKFYSLFTNVRGVSSQVKTRRYLNVVLKYSPTKNVWSYLFLRTFLRQGDYLALTLRLTVLSLLVLGFVRHDVTALVLTLLLNYLLLFQLMALYHALDYQYLTQLYPLGFYEKRQRLLGVIRRISYGLMLGQLVLSSLIFTDKLWVIVFILGQLFLTQLYLPYKVKKLID